MSRQQYKETIQLLIDICGWLYFVIWSLSFYGQVFTLLKVKSAMGMSANYIFINLTGYVMYTVYNFYGYFKGNNQQTGVVDLSDILFSAHSIFVYGITFCLFFYYPHQIKLSVWTKIYLTIQWIIFIYFGLYAFSSKKPIKLSFFGYKTSLGYFQTLGYFKMFSTLLKHPPQIYYNFVRKSTKGWSIQGMIMDFLGGLFSLIALLLQIYINPKFYVNTTKLFLSIMSMIYDVTYMVQHYVLYGDNDTISQKQLENVNGKERLTPRNYNQTNIQNEDEDQTEKILAKS